MDCLSQDVFNLFHLVRYLESKSNSRFACFISEGVFYSCISYYNSTECCFIEDSSRTHEVYNYLRKNFEETTEFHLRDSTSYVLTYLAHPNTEDHTFVRIMGHLETKGASCLVLCKNIRDMPSYASNKYPQKRLQLDIHTYKTDQSRGISVFSSAQEEIDAWRLNVLSQESELSCPISNWCWGKVMKEIRKVRTGPSSSQRKNLTITYNDNKVVLSAGPLRGDQIDFCMRGLDIKNEVKIPLAEYNKEHSYMSIVYGDSSKYKLRVFNVFGLRNTKTPIFATHLDIKPCIYHHDPKAGIISHYLMLSNKDRSRKILFSR